MRFFNKVIIFAAAVLLFAAIFQFKDERSLFDNYNYTVNIYVKNKNKNTNGLEAGSFCIVTCTKTEEDSVLKSYPNVLGKSYKFNGIEFEIERFINENNFITQFSQEINGRTVYYLYNYKISNFEIVNNKKVSMQIVKTDDYVMAGLPLIIGGF